MVTTRTAKAAPRRRANELRKMLESRRRDRGWRVFLGTALAVLLVPTGIAQTHPTTQADQQPTFRVQVWGYIAADFSTRVKSYFDLRSKLEDSPWSSRKSLP